MSELTLKSIKAPSLEIDVNGLKVVVSEPAFDLEADFDLLLGENAENQAWARKQMPYLWVHQIDGEVVWPIAHYSEFRVLRQRLGREGYREVIKAIEALLGQQEDNTKNSQGTPNSDSDAS